jgi:hypothetical protein
MYRASKCEALNGSSANVEFNSPPFNNDSNTRFGSHLLPPYYILARAMQVCERHKRHAQMRDSRRKTAYHGY